MALNGATTMRHDKRLEGNRAVSLASEENKGPLRLTGDKRTALPLLRRQPCGAFQNDGPRFLCGHGASCLS